MKKKSNKLIFLILILIIAFGIMLYFYFKPADTESTSSANIREITVGNQTIVKTITGSRRDKYKFNRRVGTKYI